MYVLSDAKALIWDNPAVVGSLAIFPNGTRYKQTGGFGKNLITAEEWLYRKDFLKGGDAFILISMEGMPHIFICNYCNFFPMVNDQKVIDFV